MNNRYENSVIIKVLSTITVLYIVSLFTVTSDDTLYIINRILFFALVSSFLMVVLLFRINIYLERIIVSTIPILLLIILSNIWAVNMSVSLNRTIGILFYYLGAITVYLLVYNKIISINKILHALFISVVILSISASYDYYFSNATRGAGLAGNPNTFGLNIVFLCPLIWAINKMKKNGGSNIIKWVTILALINASVVSGGRKVLIASVLILLFFYVFSGRFFSIDISYLKIVLALFISLLLIILIILNLGNISSLSGEVVAVDRLLDHEEASTSIRESMITTSMQLFSKKPIIGYGIDNFSVVSLYGTYSHNNYTELLVSMGSIGLILYYFVYFKILLYSKNSTKVITNNGVFYFTLFYMIVVLILEVALVNLYRPSVWLLLIVVILINKQISNYRNNTDLIVK